MKHLFLILALLPCAAAGLPDSYYNVASFGAKGDNRANDAAAIQRAIDACAKAGGGTVYFPTGNFLSGTIVLKSNVTLHFSPGATLWGSRKIEDYNPLHLIYAHDAENIGIEGDGTINGNGDAYWKPNFKAMPKRPSPLIELERCRNVRIRNIRIRNTPGHGIRPLDCDGVYIRGISMISDMRGPNTDGIDPNSSRNVIISDSYIETGDDAICLKTHPAKHPLPCENVTVNNCVLISDDSAIKLGTGSNGDFRNCVFTNCVITGTHYGIAMYIKDGGTVEGIEFSNINIDTSVDYFNQRTKSSRTWTEYPIFLDLEKRSAESPLGRIRGVNFNDIHIRTKGRILVGGMPERPIDSLSFRNIEIRKTGFERIEGLRKPRGKAHLPTAPPEIDYSNAPAALIFANIGDLNLRDVRVNWDTGDAVADRHAIYAAGIRDLFLAGFSGSALGKKFAAIGLDNVRHAFITQSRVGPKTMVFIGLHRTSAADVVLMDNDLRKGIQAKRSGMTYVHLPGGE